MINTSVSQGYSKEDSYQVELCSKIWLAMWEERAPLAFSTFETLIQEVPFVQVIDLCSELADAIIQDPEMFWTRITPYPDEDGVIGVLFYLMHLSLGKNPDESELRDVLQLLRFPKRFTLSDMDDKATIETWLSTDNRIKMFDRLELPGFIREGLRAIADSYFPRYVHRDYKPTDYWDFVPSGTTAEGFSTPFEKYLGASSMGLVPDHMSLRASIKYETTTARYTTVPKGYKTRRGICEEPLKTTLMCTPLANYLCSALESKKGPYAPYGHVTLHNQGTNRALCFEASFAGQLSTIDLSAASDSVSTQVASAVLPPSVWKDLFVLRSSEVQVGGKQRTIHMVASMGSRITFPLECHVFWCFTVLAVLMNVKIGNGAIQDLKHCAVYGDDIIIPTLYADTLIDLLNRCGFKVNSKKTFTTTSGFVYRESCGVEYINGIDVASVFWPRRVLSRGKTASWVSLHNALLAAGYTQAAGVIRGEFPDVPSVSPDSTEFGFHGTPTLKIGKKPHVAVICNVYFSGPFGDKEGHLCRILTDLPLPELSVPLACLTITTTTPVYDNRRVTVNSLFTDATISILADLFEEFCYIRCLGCAPQYYDEVCELIGVYRPRNFRREVDLTDQVRLRNEDLIFLL